MTIEVSFRKAYGKEIYRPENDVARAIVKLKKNPSFNREQLQALREVGFLVKIVVSGEAKL